MNIDAFATQVGEDMQSLRRDSGWRRLPSSPNRAGGTVDLRRVRETVRVRFNDVTLPAGSGAVLVLAGTELTTGFTAPGRGTIATVGNTTGNQTVNYLRAAVSWYWIRADDHIASTLDHSGVSLSGEITWTTDDPWPTTLPGTAA